MTFFRFILLSVLALFSVGASAQSLLLTRPSGGEAWYAYSTQQIEWASANVDFVNIELSVDNGVTWQLVASNVAASAGKFAWQVPDAISDRCFIRIKDAANANVFSTNFPTNPFRIPAPVVSIQPVPSVLFGATSYSVQWQSAGVRRVNVFLALAGTSSFTLIGANVPAEQEFFRFKLPAAAGTNCYLKVEDAEKAAIQSQSSSFGIRPLPAINEAKFAGGAYDGFASGTNMVPRIVFIGPKTSLLNAQSQVEIEWKSVGVEFIAIDFSVDGGQNWTSISSSVLASTNKYVWTVPDVVTQNGFIRLRSTLDQTVEAKNDQPFGITGRSIKLESFFKTKQKVNKSLPLAFTWKSNGVHTVSLKVVETGEVISSSINASLEVFNWIVPANAPDSFRVAILDNESPTRTDTSAFIVAGLMPQINQAKYRGGFYDGHAANTNRPPFVQLKTPNGGERYSIGQDIIVNWVSKGIEELRIVLSSDNGANWRMVDTLFPAAPGSCLLKVPSAVSNTMLLGLFNAANNAEGDTSNAVFSVTGNTVTNTTSESDWKVNLPKSISWDVMGVDNISVAYRTGILQPWISIVSGYPAGAESFNWILPSIFDSLWVRVSSTNDPTVFSIKEFHKKVAMANLAGNNAKFRGGAFDGHHMRSNVNTISIQRPQPNEQLSSGANYNLSWREVNIVDSVLLQYSIDSGKTWIYVSTVPAGKGSYNWLVPSPSGTSGQAMALKQGVLGQVAYSKCLVRAVDYKGDNGILGTSPVFTVLAAGPAIYNTVKEGFWDDPQIWEAGIVPPADASVRISHRVTIRTGATCKKVDIASGGDLKVNAGVNFDVKQ